MKKIKTITSAVLYCSIGEFLDCFGCFELVEFNYLIDDKLSPWLMSVKRNPLLTCRTKAEREVIPSIIKNVKLYIIDSI